MKIRFIPSIVYLCSRTRRKGTRVDEKPVVDKLEDSRGSVYFTIVWSFLTKAEKYRIVKSVPSDSGIFELYSMDPKGKLNLFYFGKSWYGGLRNELRVRTDPELETDLKRREVLSKYDCYYRYSLASNNDDMTDILFFFAQTYFPGSTTYKPSGRYEKVYVKEESKDKIVTI
jgi:hypothetical protein